jgi:hypothetical protein
MEFSLDACTEEYKGRFLAHYDELKWLYCTKTAWMPSTISVTGCTVTTSREESLCGN